VFAALGAKVRRIGGTGDQGVDLIVEFGVKCVAVQAKGYYHAVNNKAFTFGEKSHVTQPVIVRSCERSVMDRFGSSSARKTKADRPKHCQKHGS